MMPKKLIVWNWRTNNSLQDAKTLLKEIDKLEFDPKKVGKSQYMQKLWLPPSTSTSSPYSSPRKMRTYR
jgi:hypothetical protein